MSQSKTLEASPIIGTGFKLIIDNDVYRKVMYWVDRSEHEVSGFGSINWDKENKVFRVTSAILLDQDNGPTSSEISPHAIGKAMFEQKDEVGALKWWWHSHVNMTCFWSGDDMNCIRGLGQQGWITATVFNKKRDCRSAFYQLTDVMDNKHEIFIDEIATSVDYPIDDSKKSEWEASYNKHVTEKKYVASSRVAPLTDITPWVDKKDKYSRSERQMYLDDWGGYGGYDNWVPTVKDYSADKVEIERQTNTYGLTEDWDKEGWRMNPKTNDYQYNPVRDEALDPEKVWQAVSEMDRDEFEELMSSDKVFRAYIYETITGNVTK